MDCSMIDVCHFAVVEHIPPEGCPPVLVFQVEGKGRACKPLSLMHISSHQHLSLLIYGLFEAIKQKYSHALNLKMHPEASIS